MARLKFTGQIAIRLLFADAAQRPDRQRRRLFSSMTFCPRPAAPPIPAAGPSLCPARELEPERKAFRRVARQAFGRRLTLGDFAAQHFAEQMLLVAEIMVEHPFVDGGPPGNRIHARAGKTVRREFLQGGGQNAPRVRSGFRPAAPPFGFAGLAMRSYK